MPNFTIEDVAKVYVAYFDRAPDHDGLHYWVEKSGFTSIDQVAMSFADQKEFKENYPDGMTNEEFVNKIYNNLFGRDAEPKGLKYWVEQLDKGYVDKPHMVEAVAFGAQNGANGNDLDVINNKTAVGLYVAEELGLDLDNFSLASITDDPTTVEEAKAEAQKYVPLSFDLTTGADTFEGNLGDDTFNAGVLTLSPDDKLLDPSTTDNDILNANITANKTDEITIKNIENLNFYSMGSHTVDMTNYSGIKTFTATDGSGAITLNNIDENINIAVEGSAKGIIANFTGNVLQGNNDIFKATVKNTSSASINTSAGFEQAKLTIDGDSTISSLSVPGAGILHVDGKGNLHTKDNVLNTFAKQIFTQEGKLTLGNINGVEVLDASAIKDGVVADKTITDKQGNTFANKTITLADSGSIITGEGNDMLNIVSNGSNAIITGKGDDTISITKGDNDILSIDMGKGNDLLQVTGATTTSDDTFNLGAGEDILRLSNAQSQSATLNGVEELHIYADGSDSVNLQNADNALQRVVIETTKSGNAVTVNNIGSATSVNIINYDSVNPEGVGNLTLAWSDTEDSQTVDISTKVDGTSSHTTKIKQVKDLTLNFNDSVGKVINGATNTDAIDAQDSQTLTINAKKASYFGDITSANSATKIVKIVGDDALTVGNINSSALENVNINASKDLVLSGISNSDNALAHLSSVNLNSTNGKVAVTNGIISSNSSGLDIAISAKSAINNGKVDTPFTIKNIDGDINTAKLSGDAKADVNFAVDTGVVKNLDASMLKGGLTSTITNNDSEPTTSTTSTVVYLGAKDKNSENDIKFSGGVNSVTVNGSIGKDTIEFVSGSKIKDMNISLGAGDDTLDLTNFGLIRSDGATSSSEGVIANFSSSSKSIDGKTVSSNNIIPFDTNDDGSYEATAVNTLKTSGVDTFIGTSKADIIYASATGMTIDGKGGADTIYGGAGNDTIIGGADDDIISGGDGKDTFEFANKGLDSFSKIDTITDFNHSDDVIDFQTSNGSPKGDFITFGTNDTNFSVDVSNATSLEDAINIALGAKTATIDGHADLAVFEYDNNTYIVYDNDGANTQTFDNSNDFVIKLTGTNLELDNSNIQIDGNALS